MGEAHDRAAWIRGKLATRDQRQAWVADAAVPAGERLLACALCVQRENNLGRRTPLQPVLQSMAKGEVPSMAAACCAVAAATGDASNADEVEGNDRVQGALILRALVDTMPFLDEGL